MSPKLLFILSRWSQDLCVVGSTGYKVPDLIGDWTHLLLEHPEHLARSAGAKEKFKVGRDLDLPAWLPAGC